MAVKLFGKVLFLWFSVSFWQLTNSADLYCLSENGCENIDTTGLNYDNVFCNGYQSCRYGYLARGDLDCSGYESCYAATAILSGVNCNGLRSCADISGQWDASSSVYCNGYESCQNANLIHTFFGDIFCGGSYSCSNVGSLSAGLRNEIHCDGYASCQNAGSLGSHFDINCRGPYSCDGVGGIAPHGPGDVYCSGEYACRDAGISSNFGSTNCQGLNACEDATIRALQGVSCSCRFSCSGASIDVSGSGVSCGADSSCAGSTITNATALNCGASSACSGITANIDGDVECTGGSSCSSGTITASGYIGCTGKNGCASATLSSANSGVWCASSRSCYNADIVYLGASWLRCKGESSCTYLTTTAASNLEDLNCDGAYSCANADITSVASVETSLYCDGRYSCQEGSFVDFSNFYCRGYQSCLLASLVPSGSHVYCSGHQSCANTTINGYKSTNAILKLNGEESGLGAIIHGFENIHVSGENSLIDSIIESNGFNINVHLNDMESVGSNNTFIKCEKGDKCNINCFGGACHGINVHCHNEAECNVNCDEENGHICPNKIQTNE